MQSRVFSLAIVFGIASALVSCEKSTDPATSSGSGAPKSTTAAPSTKPSAAVPSSTPPSGDGTSPSSIASQLSDTLAKIKDSDTAKSMSGQVANLTERLEGLMKSVTSGVTADVKGLAGDLAKKAESLAPELKAALDKVTAEVTRIAGNNDLMAQLRPTIEKLKGFLPKLLDVK